MCSNNWNCCSVLIEQRGQEGRKSKQSVAFAFAFSAKALTTALGGGLAERPGSFFMVGNPDMVFPLSALVRV